MSEGRRREIMHAAVAAGGASAALMSAAIVGTEEEVLSASTQCLEPVLRAALRLISASVGLPGQCERVRLQLALEDFLDAPDGAQAQPS